MSLETATKPDVLDPSSGEPLIAHVVRKEDQTRGYMGDEITALCGKRFIPHRDYIGLPVCERCKAIREQLRNSGSN